MEDKQGAPLEQQGATVILSGPSGPPVTFVPSQNFELVLTPNVPDITVVPPEDGHLRHVIDTMASWHCISLMEAVVLSKLSGRGTGEIHFLVSYLSLDQRSIVIIFGEKSSSESRERREDPSQESSRKRHRNRSRSGSPTHKSTSKDRLRDRSRDKEKSKSRERADNGREKVRDRDMDRRRRVR